MNKKIYIILILIVFIGFDLNVYAHSAADGNPSTSIDCKHEWCYSGMGYRFSLYRYKNKNLTYYKSIDYEVSNPGNVGLSTLNGKYAHIVKDSAGKVAYQKEKKTLNWDITNWYKLDMKSKIKFPYYMEGGSFDNAKPIIENTFVIDGEHNENEILDTINNFFSRSLTIADLPYLYITVEPTMYIQNNSGQAYYGTTYELAYIEGTNRYKLGLCSKLYYSWPLSIVAANPTSSDSNNFVSSNKDALVIVKGRYISDQEWYSDCGYNNSKPGEGYLYSATNNCGQLHWNNTVGETARKYNIEKIRSKEGYGIGVFWIGDYLPEENKSCSNRCSTYQENSAGRLECAENYCESNSTNNSEKKACIISCGYEEPNTQSCSSNNCTSNTNSTCFETVTSNKKTCSYNSTSYIKTECTTSTTLKYSTELPSVFAPKTGGFNYTLKVNGSKKCKLTFNIKKFQFDYAALKRNSSGRNTLQGKLNYFNNLTADNYLYNSDFEKLNMYVDGKNYNFILVKRALNNNASNLTNKTVYLYGNSNNSQTKDKEIVSNGTFTYELPKQCLMLKNGSIVSMPIAGCGDLKEHANYYAYYNLKQSTGEVGVKINAEKDDSCLNDTNTCYYVVENDLNIPDCYLTKEESGENYIVSLNIKNKDANILSYELNGNSYNYEKDSLIDTVTIRKSELDKITAGITYKTKNGKEVMKSCPLSGKDTCKTLYNPYQYDAIRKYCNDNYLSDGFNNSDACYDYCSGDTKIKKAEYIYRPIALGESTNPNYKYNAFPRRKAGSNWEDHEDLTIKNSFEEKPIYVIELDSDSIRTIKNDTLASSKYVYKDFSNYYKDENSNLKSNFIKENKDIFTCINGIGEGC